MRTQTIGILFMVAIFETQAMTLSVSYKSVFIPETDVQVQGTAPAKNSIQCASLYQPNETKVSFFRYDQETETCLIGELKQNGTVNATRLNPSMAEFLASHELMFGKFGILRMKNYMVVKYCY